MVTNSGPLESPASQPLNGHTAPDIPRGDWNLDPLRVVVRHKWLIGLGFVIGLTLAYFYCLRAQRIYQASVQIMVLSKDTRLATEGTQRDRLEQSSGTTDFLATHVQLFKSPRIVQEAIDRHHLEGLPTFAEMRSRSPNFNPAGFILGNLTVGRGGEGQGKDASVLRASFTGPVPEDCSAILDALVDSYQDFLGKTFQDVSDEAVQLIDQAKADLEGELKTAEEDYRKFCETAPLLLQSDQKIGSPEEIRLREVEAALTQVRLRQTEVRTRLDMTRETLEKNKTQETSELELLAVIGSEEMHRISLMLVAARGDVNSELFQSSQSQRVGAAQAEFGNLLTLLLHERSLLEDHGPDHPDVQKARLQIAAAKEFLSKKAPPDPEKKLAFDARQLLTAHLRLLEHDLEQLGKREVELGKLSQEGTVAIRRLVKAEIDDDTLRADMLRKRGLYDAIIERLKKINLIKDYGGYLTQVISPVATPSSPISPRLQMLLTLGGLLGLLAGGGLAWLIEFADRTFRSPEDVRRILKLSLLGDIPVIHTTAKVASASTNGDSQRALDQALVAYHRPQSRDAEAVRGLRTALFFASRRTGQKIVQVTSPNAGDGKTTLAANLAISLAQSGKKVLLADADLRRPTVGKRFGIDAKSLGLSSVITGEATLADTILDVGIANLTVLPSGPSPPNPAELLVSAEFEQLLATLREQYDYIIIDSPPVLPVADSSEIASRVDGVILTIRISKNGVPSALEARRMLDAVDAKTLGVAVNGFERDRYYGYGSYGSGYGYGYRYGYRYGGRYGKTYGYGTSEANDRYYREEAGQAEGEKTKAEKTNAES